MLITSSDGKDELTHTLLLVRIPNAIQLWEADDNVNRNSQYDLAIQYLHIYPKK